jgi:hypothetical protein
MMFIKNFSARSHWAKRQSLLSGAMLARVTAAGTLMSLALLTAVAACAQGVGTTTVQGTVYLANGKPGTGTLAVRWPAFTTASGQAVAAGSITEQIAGDGFLSVNLAPNLGSMPAGEYYTVTFYLSDGSTSTEYWVVPAAAAATLGQVRAQVMPAAQAVQAASKAYVDQSISQVSQSLLTGSGGNLSGPLYLNADPTQPQQAADKHYVDAQVASAVPLGGGVMTGALTLSGDPTADFHAADKRYVDMMTASAIGTVLGEIPNTGTVGKGNAGQIAYYTGNGTAVGGLNAVPVASGGTGAGSAAVALANLGGLPASGNATMTGPLNLAAPYSSTTSNTNQAATAQNVRDVAARSVKEFGAKGDGIFADFKMTAGSNVVTLVDTCCGYNFQPGDLGKRISLPKVDSDGKSLYTTITGYTDSTHVTVSAAATNSFDGTGTYANQAVWGTDDSAGFASAITWAQSGLSAGQGSTRDGGAALYVPCGYYLTTSQVTISKAIILEGQEPGCSEIMYVGVSAIDAAVSVLPGGTQNVLRGNYFLTATNHPEVGTCSGAGCSPSLNNYIAGQIRNLSILGNKNSKYALSILNPANYHASDIWMYGGSAGAFYTLNGVQNIWTDLSTNTDKTYGLGACANGLYFDGSGTGQGQIPTIVENPNVSNCTGTAMTFNYVAGAVVEGAQVTLDGQSVNVLASSGGIDFIENLFEGASNPDVIAGSGNLSSATQFTGVGLTVSGSRNQFVKTTFGFNGTLAISGQNNSFENPTFGGSVAVADTSKTTQWHAVGTFGGAGSPMPNFPTDQASTLAGAWSDPVVRVRGYWTASTSTPVSIATNQFTAGEAWKAIFIGTWIDSGTAVSPASYIELTDTSNSVAVYSTDTAIFGINASGYFQMAVSSNNVGFAGEVVIVPRLGHAPGDAGTTSMQLAGLLKANAIANLNGILLASSLNGYHGSTGTKLQYSDGTGTSQAAFFDANGNLTGTAAALPNDTTTTTQTAGDNSTKIATTAYVDGKTVDAGHGGTGTANLTGVRYANGGSADTASTSAQIAAALGTTTVTNATNVGNTQNDSTNTEYYLCGLAADTSTSQGCNTASGFHFNPSNALLKVPSVLLSSNGKIYASGSSGISFGASGSFQYNGSTVGTWDSSGNLVMNGLITGANDSTRTSTTTMSNAWTTTGLVLPSVPVNTTKTGHCTIYWQMSSTSYTATFGLGMNNAPTNVWGASRVFYNGTGSLSLLAFTQSATTATAISTAATAGASSTTYEALIDFTIQTGSSNAVVMTIYGQTSNSIGTLSIMPGSSCYWLP